MAVGLRATYVCGILTIRILRLSLVASIASTCIVASGANAAPRAKTTSPTLYVVRGAPLATVDDAGNIRQASCGSRFARRAGNRIGDEWIRLDSMGRAAETVRVTDSSVYDLSGCREIATTGRSDRDDDPALYVRGPRKPPTTRAFACTAPAAAPAVLGPTPILYCTKDSSGRETARAVGGGTTLVFAHFEAASSTWKVDRAVSAPPTDRPTPADAAFKVVSVLDMNGDGSPEIVVHARRSDTYADTVYTVGAIDGTIRRIVETGGGYA